MSLNFFLVFIQPFVLSFVVAYAITWWVVRYGKRLKIIDDPATHKHPKVTHERPVPRGGGLPVYLSIIIGVAIFLLFDKKAIGIAAAMTILLVVGWLDDRYEEKISPFLRLITNGLAALCVIGAGVGISYISNPLGGVIHLDQPQTCFWLFGGTHCIWWLSDLFAFFWLVWMQNIVGWSSGVDGQLPGFVVVAAVTIAIMGVGVSNDASQIPAVILAALTAGAYAGFWLWNWYPQKIMPGYGGKSMAGFLLGVLAILSVARVGTMLLVLGIPFVDAVAVIIKRLKEGRSPVWGGREHFHHTLLDLGWSRQRIAVLYLLISIGLAILALQLKAGAKYFTMATVILVAYGGIWWLRELLNTSKRQGPDNG